MRLEFKDRLNRKDKIEYVNCEISILKNELKRLKVKKVIK